MTAATAKPFKSKTGFDAGSGDVLLAQDKKLSLAGGVGYLTRSSTILSLIATTGDLFLNSELGNATFGSSAGTTSLKGSSITLGSSLGTNFASFDGTNNISNATTHKLKSANGGTTFLTVDSSAMTLGANLSLEIPTGRSVYLGNTSTGGYLLAGGSSIDLVAQSSPLVLSALIDHTYLRAGVGKSIFFDFFNGSGSTTAVTITSSALTLSDGVSLKVNTGDMLYLGSTTTGGYLTASDGAATNLQAQQGSLLLGASNGSVSLTAGSGGITHFGSSHTFKNAAGNATYMTLDSNSLSLSGVSLTTNILETSLTKDTVITWTSAVSTSVQDITGASWAQTDYAGFVAEIYCRTGTGTAKKTQFSKLIGVLDYESSTPTFNLAESEMVDSNGVICNFDLVGNTGAGGVFFKLTAQPTQASTATVVNIHIRLFKL